MRRWLLATFLTMVLPGTIFGGEQQLLEGKSVQEWIQQLSSKDARLRRDAAQILGQRQAFWKEALPALLTALQDSDEGVRRAAHIGLAGMGKEAVPALTAVLQDGSKPDTLRSAMAGILGQIGSPAAKAVPALLEILKDKNMALQLPALEALRQIGFSKDLFPQLLSVAQKGDEAMQQTMLKILWEQEHPPKEALPLLIQAATNQNYRFNSWRVSAITMLQRLGPDALPSLGQWLQQSSSSRQVEAGDLVRAFAQYANELVPLLHQRLKDKNASNRPTVAGLLGILGSAAKDAVPTLCLVFNEKGDDQSLRVAVLHALAAIGTPPDLVADTLTAALKDADTQMRIAAANALRRMGPAAKKAVPALMEALKDKDKSLRLKVVLALAAFGESAADAVPALLATLKEKPAPEPKVHPVRPPDSGSVPLLLPQTTEVDVAEAAQQTLVAIGKPAVPGLILMLSDEDKAHRLAAVKILAGMGESAREAGPALLQFLKDPNAEMRLATVKALVSLRVQANFGVPALQIALRDSDLLVRRAVVHALAAYGPAAKEANAILIDVFKDKDETLRLGAIQAIKNIGDHSQETVFLLARALRAENGAVVSVAYDALMTLGKKAIPALRQALQEPDLELRRTAAYALGEMGPPALETAPQLRLLLSDGDKFVRCNAAKALGRVGSKTSVSALAAALGDPEYEVQNAASEALQTFGSEAVPALRLLLYEKNRKLREQAVYVLRHFGTTTGKEAVALLREVLKDTDWEIHYAAAQSLGSIAVPVGEKVSALLQVLEQRNNPRAAKILGQLGEAAQEAVPLLTKYLSDPNPPMRLWAASALISIQKETPPAALKVLRLGLKENYYLPEVFNALAACGPKARVVLPDLEAIVKEGGMKGNFAQDVIRKISNTK